MLAAGALTSTMLYAAVAPRASLQSTFGEQLDSPVAEIVIRNWGALIGLIGAMLLYGAYHPPSQPLVLTVAGLSKVVFIGLVLSTAPVILAIRLASRWLSTPSLCCSLPVI
jgi:hypothetical protein